MNFDLKGEGGVVTATIHITRKATGAVETYNLTMPVSREQAELLQEAKNDSNPLIDGSQRSD